MYSKRWELKNTSANHPIEPFNMIVRVKMVGTCSEKNACVLVLANYRNSCNWPVISQRHVRSRMSLVRIVRQEYDGEVRKEKKRSHQSIIPNHRWSSIVHESPMRHIRTLYGLSCSRSADHARRINSSKRASSERLATNETRAPAIEGIS